MMSPRPAARTCRRRAFARMSTMRDVPGVHDEHRRLVQVLGRLDDARPLLGLHPPRRGPGPTATLASPHSRRIPISNLHLQGEHHDGASRRASRRPRRRSGPGS